MEFGKVQHAVPSCFKHFSHAVLLGKEVGLTCEHSLQAAICSGFAVGIKYDLVLALVTFGVLVVVVSPLPTPSFCRQQLSFNQN